ncbi:unnamed protein product [Lactuca saligna]|uniref:Uncharacterized protein n=1 Tax=Lactuca saligna TaxID=75948 RepID=A0AA36EKI5_LACSI|nr:unnamed protein product [Lactuca saligna]
MVNSLTSNNKSALGKRLVLGRRRFQSMGQDGQGELQRVTYVLLFTNKGAKKVVGWALSHHLMQHAQVDEESSILSKFWCGNSNIIQYRIENMQAVQNESNSLKKSLKDVVMENEFKKRLLADVILPSDIGVTFDEIGALEKVKDTLKELVLLIAIIMQKGLKVVSSQKLGSDKQLQGQHGRYNMSKSNHTSVFQFTINPITS